jgi:hypothetical protein
MPMISVALRGSWNCHPNPIAMTKYPDKAPSASFPLRLRQPEIHRLGSYPQVIHRLARKLSTFAQVGFISCHRLQMFVMLSVILT